MSHNIEWSSPRRRSGGKSNSLNSYGFGCVEVRPSRTGKGGLSPPSRAYPHCQGRRPRSAKRGVSDASAERMATLSLSG